jgi:uncharacterized membrane protein HdeD (DUF308 family)
MKTISSNFWGQTRYWWVVLLIGLCLVLGGLSYWFWPVYGYAVAAQLFGWLLLVAGVVQVCASAGVNRPKGWGWWLAGGIIDMFFGFMLVRSVVLSELLLPYFLAVVMIYWGVTSMIAAVSLRNQRYWWLQLINGILLFIIGLFFLEAGYVQNVMMVSFLSALAFIYWGFTVAMTSYEMKPYNYKSPH